MRTALAAAVLGSAALLGSAGTAVADQHAGDVMGVGNQVMKVVSTDNDSYSWIFGKDDWRHGR
ncbi:hypothetical protein [Streptomyces sp. NPDC048650]